MSNETKSKTAVGLLTALGGHTQTVAISPGREFNVSLSGTFSATISLLRKVQQGRGPLSIGAHTGADAAAALTQADAGWTVDELIGKFIYNETDGSLAPITDNDATTVTGTLAGGSGDEYDGGDVWSLWETRATYTAAANPQPALTEPEDGVEYMLAVTAYASGKCYGRIGQAVG